MAADEAHANSDAGDVPAEAGSTEGGVSDPRCSVVNQGLVDECPDGSMCIQTDYVDGEGFYECMDTCTAPQDCDTDRDCYDYSNTGSPVCGPERESCDVTADADSCTCDFDDGTRRPILLVRGSGDDCEVVEAERTACYWMFGDCLEDCTPRFYRYDLGDGTALIAAPGNGELPPGWTVDSPKGALAPDSCPEVYGHYEFE